VCVCVCVCVFVWGGALSQPIPLHALCYATSRRWNRIRGKGAAAMAEGLRANSCVEVLDLGWNGIGDDGFVAFGELLGTDTAHLVELVLRYVHLAVDADASPRLHRPHRTQAHHAVMSVLLERLRLWCTA
jgi:hypothetical protein